MLTVQLPVFNERHVVERLIDAASALDYPAGRLQIQVLDDSDDATTTLARARVEYHQRRGVDIQLLHREQRTGYKAGALAAALLQARGELLAIFDADFVPPRDCLRRLVPHLTDPRVGVVQARWAHLNATDSALTRAQALALDGHFLVEQAGRAAGGLLLTFNGSAGVWRRACIEAAGGWQIDTLSEDLDLSYRAQIAGWRVAYRPEVVVPAEVPQQLAGFKRQQARWARGCVQVLRKLGGPLWAAPLSLGQKFWATVHLAAYLAYPLLLLALLLSLPLAALGAHLPGWFGWLTLPSFGPPLLYTLGQWGAYPDWPRRLAYFPVLMALGLGLMVNNTLAIWGVVTGQPVEFARTPKFGPDAWQGSGYAMDLDASVWMELALAGYAAVAFSTALTRSPSLAPFTALMAVGLAITGLTGLWQGLVRPPAAEAHAPKSS